MKAWHFVGSKLRDGRPVPVDGVKLVHEGELRLCRSGLHASSRIIDALRYSPGNTICRVKCGGEITTERDKLVCTERTILWRVDGANLLRDFARRCALDVSHLWGMSDVVRKFLETGDESLHAAAYYAAYSAAYSAANSAAYHAAYHAAYSAAYSAAYHAAYYAEFSAAYSAAYYAARAAAVDAADYAATCEARDAQNVRLEEMVSAAR